MREVAITATFSLFDVRESTKSFTILLLCSRGLNLEALRRITYRASTPISSFSSQTAS
jgi:hypothetical protein